MGAGSVLLVVLKESGILAGSVLSLAYPLYASVRAIESKSPVDNQQWLTYWVLYSMIAIFEFTFAKILEWIPIWPYGKLILTSLLIIPQFSGTAYVYEHYVRPFYLNPQTLNIWNIPGKKDSLGKPKNVLAAAENYIKEQTEAFDNMLNKAGKPRKSSRHANGRY